MGGPLNFKFANHFIIYQKRPLRRRFGTGRLHSELWDWGVKSPIDSEGYVVETVKRIFNTIFG